MSPKLMRLTPSRRLPAPGCQPLSGPRLSPVTNSGPVDTARCPHAVTVLLCHTPSRRQPLGKLKNDAGPGRELVGVSHGFTCEEPGQ